MLSTPDGPFINLPRLNMAKYGARQNLAKALFEYIFHHENDVRNVSIIKDGIGAMSHDINGIVQTAVNAQEIVQSLSHWLT